MGHCAATSTIGAADSSRPGRPAAAAARQKAHRRVGPGAVSRTRHQLRRAGAGPAGRASGAGRRRGRPWPGSRPPSSEHAAGVVAVLGDDPHPGRGHCGPARRHGHTGHLDRARRASSTTTARRLLRCPPPRRRPRRRSRRRRPRRRGDQLGCAVTPPHRRARMECSDGPGGHRDRRSGVTPGPLPRGRTPRLRPATTSRPTIARQRAGIGVGSGQVLDHSALAHDRDHVGRLQHFVELVADQRDRPTSATTCRNTENSCSLSAGVRTMGLVEDEDGGPRRRHRRSPPAVVRRPADPRQPRPARPPARTGGRSQ